MAYFILEKPPLTWPHYKSAQNKPDSLVSLKDWLVSISYQSKTLQVLALRGHIEKVWKKYDGTMVMEPPSPRDLGLVVKYLDFQTVLLNLDLTQAISEEEACLILFGITEELKPFGLPR